jgi:hypothetical protein
MEVMARFSHTMGMTVRVLLFIVAIQCVLMATGTTVVTVFNQALELFGGAGMAGGGYGAMAMLIVLPVAGLCLIVNCKSDLTR